MVLETSSMLAVTRLYIFIVTESSFVIGVTVFSRHFVMTSLCPNLFCPLCIMIADVDDGEMCSLSRINDFYCCFESLTSMCIAKLLIVS